METEICKETQRCFRMKKEKKDMRENVIIEQTEIIDVECEWKGNSSVGGIDSAKLKTRSKLSDLHVECIIIIMMIIMIIIISILTRIIIIIIVVVACMSLDEVWVKRKVPE